MRAIVHIILSSTLATSGCAADGDAIPARGGAITIRPISHAAVAIAHGRSVVLVDPARFVPGYPVAPKDDLQELAKSYIAKHGAPPAMQPGAQPDPEFLVSALPVRPEQVARFRTVPVPTLILVTHDDSDHLDPGVIAALRGPDTRVIVPTAATWMLPGLQGVETMANGARVTIGDLTVEAVPMYNTAPDAQFGAVWHAKGRGNGYVLTLADRRIYVAGDTACTPEMRALERIDVAFVPMNLPYTMSPAEAAECIIAMRPRIVYPYHYADSDPKTFETALAGSGVEVRLRDWYRSQRP